MLLLQQYNSRLKTSHTCGSTGFGDSLVCQSSSESQSHNTSVACVCSSQTVKEEEPRLSMSDTQDRPAGKRCHPADDRDATLQMDKRPKSEIAY